MEPNEQLRSELQDINSRLAVHAEKLSAIHETLREALLEAKRTNGRIYAVEAQVASVEKRTDSNSSDITQLKTAERRILSAGWKITAALVTGAGVVSALASAAVEALAR